MVNEHEANSGFPNSLIGNQENNLEKIGNGEALPESKSLTKEIAILKGELNRQEQELKCIREKLEKFPMQLENKEMKEIINHNEALLQQQEALTEMKTLYESAKQIYESTIQVQRQVTVNAEYIEEYAKQEKEFISKIELARGKLQQLETQIQNLANSFKNQKIEWFAQIKNLIDEAISQQTNKSITEAIAHQMKTLEQQASSISLQIQKGANQRDARLTALKKEMQTAISETVSAFSRRLKHRNKKLAQIKTHGEKQDTVINNKFREYDSKIIELERELEELKDKLETNKPTTPYTTNYYARLWEIKERTLYDELTEAQQKEQLLANIKELTEAMQRQEDELLMKIREATQYLEERLRLLEEKNSQAYEGFSTQLANQYIRLTTCEANVEQAQAQQEQAKIANRTHQTNPLNPKVLQVSTITMALITVAAIVVASLANLGKLPTALNSQASSLNMIAVVYTTICLIILEIMLVNSFIEDTSIRELHSSVTLSRT